MKYLVLLFLLCSIPTLSQNSNGIVEYKVSLTKKDSSKLDNMLLKMANNLYTISNEFEFKLKFDKKSSLFLLEKKIYSDDMSAQLAKVKIGYRGRILQKHGAFYVEENSQQLVSKKYIIKKDTLIWKLTKQRKKINNFLCYKATSIKTVNVGKKTSIHNIEAWYTPEINVPFGPSFYGNLPGLILELKTKDFVYGVKKISFIKEKELLNSLNLKDYPIITESEFEDKIRSSSSFLFED